jgi:hypothetical protein
MGDRAGASDIARRLDGATLGRDFPVGGGCLRRRGVASSLRSPARSWAEPCTRVNGPMQRVIRFLSGTRLAVLAGAVVLSAGCAGSHRADGGPRSADVPRMPPLVAQMGTPDEIARWAARECTGAGQMACYDATLHTMLGPRGVHVTMETLARMTALDTSVARDGHVYAHGIGISAYHGAATMAATFAECTPLHQSGCYHGVIQAYFADVQAHGGGITPQTVDAACREQTDAWLLFQCAHGVGHGLTALYGHDLPRALTGCDLLSTGYQREACYGGVFMENIVAVSSPQHHHEITSALDQVATASSGGSASTGGDEHAGMAGMAGMEHGEHAHAAADTGAHAGHAGMAMEGGAEAGHEHAGHEGMAGMAGMDHSAHAASAWKPVDAHDAQYPCSVVDERYKPACYSMQTSVMLYLTTGDVAAAARGCDAAPERHRGTCFISLGRDINAIARQQHGPAREMCGQAKEEYRAWCHQGVAKNLVDQTSSAGDALAYCGELPAGPDKGKCFQGVGEELRYLLTDTAKRDEACHLSDAAFVDECRRGAALPQPARSSGS